MKQEMTITSINIVQRPGRRPTVLLPLVLLFLLAGGAAFAQSPQDEAYAGSAVDTIPAEARAVFDRYVQRQGTSMEAFVRKHRRDRFIKRFSFHTNAVDWVTLVPNLGIEFDLKGTPRTNYSVALFGKFNGRSRHGKLVYNVNAVRVEGRKYWRTGKFGNQDKYHAEYRRISTDTASIYFNADTVSTHTYYVDNLGKEAKAMGISMESLRATPDMTQEQRDSLDFAGDSLGIRERKFRTWYRKTYSKFRRNVLSGRILDNPRNWRAYYFGVWAAIDNWSISFTGNGRQGNGVGAGLVAGYTLPLLPQRFPREGSLDLDFGLAVGYKAVQYSAYTYEERTQHYVYDRARSHEAWKVIPYPIVQDIHVSLVWRFRGIKSKVDRSLIDDYERNVSRYQNRINAAENRELDIRARRSEIVEAIGKRQNELADSTALWDTFHRRRHGGRNEDQPRYCLYGCRPGALSQTLQGTEVPGRTRQVYEVRGEGRRA